MAAPKNSPFETELQHYEAHKSEWLKGEKGKFVLVQGESTAGFYPTYEQALEAGLRRFGYKGSFLIKQVVETEPVFVIY